MKTRRVPLVFYMKAFSKARVPSLVLLVNHNFNTPVNFPASAWYFPGFLTTQAGSRDPRIQILLLWVMNPGTTGNLGYCHKFPGKFRDGISRNQALLPAH